MWLTARPHVWAPVSFMLGLQSKATESTTLDAKNWRRRHRAPPRTDIVEVSSKFIDMDGKTNSTTSCGSFVFHVGVTGFTRSRQTPKWDLTNDGEDIVKCLCNFSTRGKNTQRNEPQYFGCVKLEMLHQRHGSNQRHAQHRVVDFFVHSWSVNSAPSLKVGEGPVVVDSRHNEYDA